VLRTIPNPYDILQQRRANEAQTGSYEGGQRQYRAVHFYANLGKGVEKGISTLKESCSSEPRNGRRKRTRAGLGPWHGSPKS